MVRTRMGWSGLLWAAMLSIAAGTAAAEDIAGAGAASPPAATATAAPSVAATVKKTPAKPARAIATAARPSRPAAAAATARPSTAPRTLDPVHIEGELDVPEVLFITARDQRRIVGFQHARYLPGSRDIARSTPLPSHVVVDRKAPPAREEGGK